jgi:drug/metabolite transporter (DMT)-like permease
LVNSGQVIGEAASLGSAGLWALSTVAIKGVTGRLSASYIMAIRTGIAALLILAVALVVGLGQNSLDLPFWTVVLLVASAPTAAGGDLCFVRALALADVSRVFTLTTSLYILFSVAGGLLFLGEDLSWLLPLGAVAIVFGSRLVLQDTRVEPAPLGEAAVLTKQATGLGVLGLSVVAGLLWASGLLVLSEALEDAEPVAALTLRLPIMAVAMIALAGVQGHYGRFGFAPDNLRVLALSGALTLCSMLCFLLAADRAEAGIVAVLTSTSPIFAAALAWLVLKEQITRRVLVGTAACMLGVWLSVA